MTNLEFLDRKRFPFLPNQRRALLECHTTVVARLYPLGEEENIGVLVTFNQPLVLQ